MNRTYLDYAAATPLDATVAKKMHEAEKLFANPSSQYASGREARNLSDSSRKNIAMFFGANSDEVIFTSGATESNNLAILGAARAAGKGKIISLATEHASVREPIAQLAKEGFDIAWCKVDSKGKINLEDFKRQLSKDTILVSISYANSEIGTIEPIAKIAQIIRKFEQGNATKIIFHTDASGAVATLNCDVSRLGVDLLTCSAAKVYGPKGVGLLYVKRNTKLLQLIYGGSQELGLRAGTENISLICGFSQALTRVHEHKEIDSKKYQQLYVQCIHNLEGVSYIENGHPADRLHMIVSLCFEGVNGENLVAYLDANGFEVATGAACEASSDKPSAALLAIGRTKLQAQGSLRVSFGRTTTSKDIDRFVECLKKTISTLL